MTYLDDLLVQKAERLVPIDAFIMVYLAV